MNNQSGFSISKPVKFWNKPLKADFPELFRSLGKCAVDSLSRNWGEAAKDTVEVTAAVGLETTPEEKAWTLIYNSLSQAMFSLLADNKELFTEKPNQSDLDLFSTGLSQTLENAELRIDEKFFIQPKNLSIIPDIQKALKNWLKYFVTNQTQAEMISNRLPIYFVYELNKQWAKHPNKYASLKEEINTPFTQASEKEQAWQLYLAWLQKQIEEPMFLEAFGLKSVYVPLRAYYKRKIDDKDDEFERRIREEEKYERVVVDLETELETWLNKKDTHDAIRVISGGPGSGKSSFAKIFAAKQAEKGEINVLFIPLHQFKPSEDLVDAVGKFVRDDEFLSHNPLEDKAESRLLIIFDGLDELAMQGKIASEIAQQFVREVQRKVERFNGRGETRLQVLISGREVVVQDNSSDFRKPEQILHILPYFVTENEKETHKYIDSQNLLEHDQRNDWWEQYGLASGFNYSNLPSELNQENLIEITAQPLLNYLVALSFVRGEVNFSQENNLNVIYQDLLKAVYERDWAGYQHPSLQGITEQDFVRILEEIALAAWHGNGRTTTVQEIEAHCQNSSLERLLNIFQEGAKLGLTRLLAAFYFRESGVRGGEKTFEFTHNSFGEYLTARRIVRGVKRIHYELEALENDLDRGWDVKQSLFHWLILCSPSMMNEYLFNFILDELHLHNLSDVSKWQKTLSILFSFMLRYGMPMDLLSVRRDFYLENFQSRNAEEALLIVLNACARVTREISNIKSPYIDSFGIWISRVRGQRLNEYVVALKFLSFLNLSKSVLHIQDFFGANLEGSNLENTKLAFTNLITSNLKQVNFQNANLSRSNLQGANLQGANLQGANLQGVDLEGANLQGANLQEADLKEGNLKNANLQDTNLENANLESADLTFVDLKQSNLKKANLKQSTFVPISLENADLRQVNFEETYFHEDNLIAVNFGNMKIEGANLKGTILEDQDLTKFTQKPDSDPNNQNTST
jgi:uncharacterized protein YjbI with pentapeptide repeats/adenylate kinase family enzyme